MSAGGPAAGTGALGSGGARAPTCEAGQPRAAAASGAASPPPTLPGSGETLVGAAESGRTGKRPRRTERLLPPPLPQLPRFSRPLRFAKVSGDPGGGASPSFLLSAKPFPARPARFTPTARSAPDLKAPRAELLGTPGKTSSVLAPISELFSKACEPAWSLAPIQPPGSPGRPPRQDLGALRRYSASPRCPFTERAEAHTVRRQRDRVRPGLAPGLSTTSRPWAGLFHLHRQGESYSRPAGAALSGDRDSEGLSPAQGAGQQPLPPSALNPDK